LIDKLAIETELLKMKKELKYYFNSFSTTIKNLLVLNIVLQQIFSD